ncbi:MAG TPA: heat-inducible transcriptional repressor HrcA [Melioribacteraceae bacterium]|nr:heat-inducible transcriptional repressor HrcA [Melioribacteraceae bacterium]
MENYILNDREKAILRNVIHQFILTANPVGSRNIARKYNLGLSPATIRNIMSDLEETGFLGHPHTSAGRIPTDKGYRLYVDSLMEITDLAAEQKNNIIRRINQDSSDTEDLLRISSIILSEITNQLACVTFPKFESAILEKIQILQLSSKRILIVLSIKSGHVKTITLELDTEIELKDIEKVQIILNERLTDLTFNEIKKTFTDRIKDAENFGNHSIIRLFLDSADKIFSDINFTDKAFITGAKNILRQPEFDDAENFQSIIELIENKDIIIHIMDSKKPDGNSVSVSIGSENPSEILHNYSFVIKDYKVGETIGILGIVGPKRMEYSKSIAAILYIADILTSELKKKQ